MRIDDEDGRNDLLIYANEQFRGADRIRFLVDDFSAEIIALELKFHGVRVVAGLSRPLWEHSPDFAALRAHMEKHRWRDTVNSVRPPKLRVLLGDAGWVEWE